MKIEKYRPNFFSGFEDIYYEVKSKEELLESDLCKYCIDNGFEICFSKVEEDYGLIMAIKEVKNKDGAEWWVLAIIDNEKDMKTLTEWLPDWEYLCKEYKKQLNNNKAIKSNE